MKSCIWRFRFWDYALLSAPGAPLKKALDAGNRKDIMGSYDKWNLSADLLLSLKMRIVIRKRHLSV